MVSFVQLLCLCNVIIKIVKLGDISTLDVPFLFTNISNKRSCYLAPEYFHKISYSLDIFIYQERHNFVVFQTITLLVFFVLCNTAASHLRSFILTFYIFYSFQFSSFYNAGLNTVNFKLTHFYFNSSLIWVNYTNINLFVSIKIKKTFSIKFIFKILQWWTCYFENKLQSKCLHCNIHTF